jgi:hypothetical protein
VWTALRAPVLSPHPVIASAIAATLAAVTMRFPRVTKWTLAVTTDLGG